MNEYINFLKKRVKQILPGNLPSFFIVGAQKSATTSLHGYLNQHPSLVGSRPKEVRFFENDDYYKMGIDWYKTNFPTTRIAFSKLHYFESSPSYLYRKKIAKRIFDFNQNAKIIIILRDPVQRAFSAWNMYFQFRSQPNFVRNIQEFYKNDITSRLYEEFIKVESFPDFETVVKEDILRYTTNSEIEEPSIVRRGIYAEQVQRYFELFGRDNVLVLGFKDIAGPYLKDNLNLILELLSLPKSDWHFLKAEQRNKSTYKMEMTGRARKILEEFYQEHNKNLFDLLNSKPNW